MIMAINEKAKREEVFGLKMFWDDLNIEEIRPDWSKAPVISDADFRTLLGVGRRTTVRWRMEGKIRYVQFGRKVYYTVLEVERFISRYEKYKNRYFRAGEV